MYMGIKIYFSIFEGVDGQDFSNLNAGRYTVTIEATGVENAQETAIDVVGPIILSGAAVSNAEAIGKLSDSFFLT